LNGTGRSLLGACNAGALSGATLAAAAYTLDHVAALALGSLSCTPLAARRTPPIALSGVTLAAAAASARLSLHAAALALGRLSGTGRSLLGAHAPLIALSGVTLAAAAAAAFAPCCWRR